MRIHAIVDSTPRFSRPGRSGLLAAVVGALLLPLGPAISGSSGPASQQKAVGSATRVAYALSSPLRGARVSAPYGRMRHPLSGKSVLHSGIDLAAPAGAPVLSAGDGVVETATTEYVPSKNSGTVVVVDHGNELKTFYAHLGELSVRAGQRVTRGQQIALVGLSGLTTGPHVHFEVWKNGKHVDPAANGGEVLGAEPAGGPAVAGSGEFDQAPRLLEYRKPEYPKEAFDQKIEGVVKIELLIDAGGGVARARVVESVPLLDRAALDAVQQWVFKPATKRGRPVASSAVAPVAFKIY